MRFSFSKIGAIREAELALNDLTIVVGENNTGKTYLTYLLYGFLDCMDSIESHALRNDLFGTPLYDEETEDAIAQIGAAIGDTGEGSIDRGADYIRKLQRDICTKVCDFFSKEVLPTVFSASKDKFSAAQLGVLDMGGAGDSPNRTEEIRYRGNGRGVTVLTARLINSEKILFTMDAAEEQSLPAKSIVPGVRGLLYRLLFGSLSTEPFILSAERFGISLFYKELDLAKNRLVDELQKLSDRERDRDPFVLVTRQSARYAKPIKDNIEFTRDLQEIQKQDSEFARAHPDILKRVTGMMRAYYRATEEEIRFISTQRKEKRFDIPLHLASASARGLSDLYFFLKHKAKSGMLLMIDEPEGHLHPKNQILMARLLSLCVNAGIRVFVTTHSDYFVKEINNLIRLSNDFDGRDDFLKRHRRQYSSADCLKPESVTIYLCEAGKLKHCPVGKKGAAVPSFDATIDEINRISNELFLSIDDE